MRIVNNLNVYAFFLKPFQCLCKKTRGEGSKISRRKDNWVKRLLKDPGEKRKDEEEAPLRVEKELSRFHFLSSLSPLKKQGLCPKNAAHVMFTFLNNNSSK